MDAVTSEVKFGGLPLFSAVHGEALVETGDVYVKKPHPVFMVRMNEPFAVETNEGTIRGKKGDWLAHDPITGHVWPISDEYKDRHYALRVRS